MRCPRPLLALLLAAIPACCGAGDTRFGPGVAAALGAGSFGGVDGGGHGMRICFEAGLVGAIHLGRIVSVRPELLVSLKGSRWDTAATVWDLPAAMNVETQLTYIDVPVFIVLSVPRGRRVQPTLVGGAHVGLCVAADALVDRELSTPLGPVVRREKIDIKDEVHTLDAGVSAGMGLRMPVSMGAVFCELRWQWGLVAVFTGSDAPQLRNTGFMVTFGYHF